MKPAFYSLGMIGSTYAARFKLWAIRGLAAIVAGALIGTFLSNAWTGYEAIFEAEERQARLLELEQKIEEARREVKRLRSSAAELRDREPGIAMVGLNSAEIVERDLYWLNSEAESIRSWPAWGERSFVGVVLGATILGVIPVSLSAWFLFLLMLRQIGGAVRGQDE